MDDIYEIRRKNLNVICVTRADGNQSKLARELELAQSLVNRYLKQKPIGDDVARKVEQVFKLDFGWMDNSHATGREQQILQSFRAAHPEIQSAVERTLNVPFKPAPELRVLKGKRLG